MKKLIFLSAFLIGSRVNIPAIAWEEVEPNGHHIKFHDEDNDGNVERAEVDRHPPDGHYEEYWIDDDGDGKWDRVWFDRDKDEVWEGGQFDTNEDGSWDHVWTDFDPRDGKSDLANGEVQPGGRKIGDAPVSKLPQEQRQIINSSAPREVPDSSAFLMSPRLVALWTFDLPDEIQPDKSGNQHNAVVEGAGWVHDDRRKGGVVSFEQAGQHLEVTDWNALSITGDLSITAWIFVSNYDGFRSIIGKTRSGGPAPYNLYFSPGDGLARVSFGDGLGQNGHVAAVRPIQTGKWEHVAVIRRGNTVTHYLNGEENGSGLVSITTADGDGALRIGNRDDGATQFAGLLDEVAIIDGAITTEQVRTVMAGDYAGVLHPGSDEPRFEITRMESLPDSTVRLTWASQPNYLYAIETSRDLAHWETFPHRFISLSKSTVADVRMPDGLPGFARVRFLQIGCVGDKPLARVIYSECGSDGFWHVVEDNFFPCPPGPPGPPRRVRLKDTRTDQPCSSPAPSIIGTEFEVLDDNCVHQDLAGVIQLFECVDGQWAVKFHRLYRCDGGSVRIEAQPFARRTTQTPGTELPPYVPN